MRGVGGSIFLQFSVVFSPIECFFFLLQSVINMNTDRVRDNCRRKKSKQGMKRKDRLKLSYFLLLPNSQVVVPAGSSSCLI